MRDAVNITIEEIIIDILDPQGQGLILSNVPLPLEGDQALVDYFTSHIETTLRDSSIKAASFKNINPEQPSGFCQAILSKETPITEGSQKLAEALYGIMDGDRRITAGDLAVVLFSAENYPYSRFLAIIKIDPSQIFRHVIREDRRGNVYVSFEPETMAFTNERLQKCAIVQPLNPRHPEYDMLLLDRQTSLEERSIARFFTESFLDAEEAFDPRKYSERFYRGVVAAQNRVKDLLTPEDEAVLDEHIRSAVSSPRVNCDVWLEDLPLPEQVVLQIDESISEYVPERQFNLDTGLSKRLARWIKVRGDHGFRLDVPAENYWTIVVSEELISDDPDRAPYHRIVIETEDWRRVV